MNPNYLQDPYFQKRPGCPLAKLKKLKNIDRGMVKDETFAAGGRQHAVTKSDQCSSQTISWLNQSTMSPERACVRDVKLSA